MQPAAPATPEPEEEKPKEKPKDPLAALPPSKMIMDSWKRLYSNTPAAKFQEICVNGLWNGADIPNSPNQEVSKRTSHSSASLFPLKPSCGMTLTCLQNLRCSGLLVCLKAGSVRGGLLLSPLALQR